MISLVINQSQPTKTALNNQIQSSMKIYMYIVVKTSLLPSKNDEFHENAHFFFYKKLPLFIKNCPLLFIKNSMLQIVIYKTSQELRMLSRSLSVY